MVKRWALVTGIGASLVSASVARADALSTPAMTPPLSANPNPTSFDAGPLGKLYVTGALTGLGLAQDHHIPGDHPSYLDLSNAQIFVQKTDGPVQFFIQAGGYSLPSLGTPYLRASSITRDTFGVIPQAYVKFAPSAEFNVMVGKLPTLIGAEYTFTFQNMNIARGLLWNQEPAVSRGVQANYAKGPLTVSASWNDGYYSDRYTWGSGLITYAFDPNNSLTLAAAANFKHNSVSTFTTPVTLNNSEIYNLIYTHTAGPLTITPYLQYNHVPALPSRGVLHSASTTGGAVLAKWSFTPSFAIAGRAEYIRASGGGGVTNLLYGPGSKAWSLTATPTWQLKTFFVRGELSYTRLADITPGFGFGGTGEAKSQARAMVETGLLF